MSVVLVSRKKDVVGGKSRILKLLSEELRNT